MLHDHVMSRAAATMREAGIDSSADPALDLAAGVESALATHDRRQNDRVPFPGELILIWNHDAALRHRYHILDAGDGGYRIRTSLPLLEGTTGMVLRLLTGDMTALAQPVMVAWCRPDPDAAGAFEVGLRQF